ncbi:class I SAM-dependent methyltransferase [Rhodopseudomonas sp. B29]|uniref:class I SAM-dependent methyltransferase n=1 Tax=Rhodopseudomonas sp. B29 TaxID=95607 RepID=UPI0003499AD0|nr:class I SAM-dependent methyltransferase [Rhodopseudomonas sp. B29]
MSEASRQFWDKMAERYAARPIKDVAAYEAMLADVATRLSPTDRVLEIGCGTGGAAIRLGGGVARWDATDLSPEMVRIARSKVAPTQVSFDVGDALAAPDRDSYDVVCAFLILHLVDDLDATLAGIHRRLNPGGLLISKTYCLKDMNVVMRGLALPVLRALGWLPPIRMLGVADLRAAFARAGFAIEDAKTFGTNRHAHYIVARKRAN